MSIRPGSPDVGTVLRKHGVASILVVEDDEMLREGVLDFIEMHGYTAVGVGNGVEALTYLEAVPLRPKLILLDLMMPIMNGWELLNRLRQSVAFATIPLVIMSAHRDRAVPDQAFPIRFVDSRSTPICSWQSCSKAAAPLMLRLRDRALKRSDRRPARRARVPGFGAIPSLRERKLVDGTLAPVAG